MAWSVLGIPGSVPGVKRPDDAKHDAFLARVGHRVAEARQGAGLTQEELAERIEAWAASRTGFLWDTTLQEYFRNVAQNTRLWVAVCQQLD